MNYNQMSRLEWTNMPFVSSTSQELSNDNILPPHSFDFFEAQDLPISSLNGLEVQSPNDEVLTQNVLELEAKCGRLEQELCTLRAHLAGHGALEEYRLENENLRQELLSLSARLAEQEESVQTVSFQGVATEGRRRKYVRKPKPDNHAPSKPLTAYAQFANDNRKKYTDQGLSFAETARRIGVDWQSLSDELRELYLLNAQSAKDAYETKLLAYSKTSAHRQYQSYLQDFNVKMRQKSLEENRRGLTGPHSV